MSTNGKTRMESFVKTKKSTKPSVKKMAECKEPEEKKMPKEKEEQMPKGFGKKK
jgi:hypothetical protein